MNLNSWFERPDFNRECRGFVPIRNLSEVNSPSFPTKGLISVKPFFFESTFQMFYTYIIYSNKADKFYIGATENLEQRLAKHRNKNKGFTNQADDWQIVYSKEFQTKTEALAYERLIKNWKSKKKIISLIESK